MQDIIGHQSYPAINRHLSHADGKLPPTVLDWVSGSLSENDHARHLDDALAWGECVLRFKSVRRTLREEQRFWETYSQLRLAWWLHRSGLKIIEFEPPTVGTKRADFRSQLAGIELDSEVTSPNPSASEVRSVRGPLSRLKEALKASEIDGVNIYLDHNGQATFESLTDEAAGSVARELAFRLQDEPIAELDETVFEFENVIVQHVKITGLPEEVQPSDQPLRLVVHKASGPGVVFTSGTDIMAFSKPSRPAADRDDSARVNWITSTLLEKAAQLDPTRHNGIWIEGTRDSNVLSAITAPWGLTQAIEEFWATPQSQHIDFVALFELAPGYPFVLPGVMGLVMEPQFNPRSRLAADDAALKAINELWTRWAEQIHDKS